MGERKITYDSMEFTPFIPLRSTLSVFGLARAELTEVFGRFGGRICEEFHFDAAKGFACGGGEGGIRVGMFGGVAFQHRGSLGNWSMDRRKVKAFVCLEY